MLPEVARLMLAQYHKDESKCSEVLQSVAVLLQHVTLQHHYNAVNAVIQDVVLCFWELYQRGKMSPLCRSPFLSCVTQLTSPHLVPAVRDTVSSGDILCALARDEISSVRLHVVRIVDGLLHTTPAHQLEIFHMFTGVFDSLCQDGSSSLSSPCRIYLLFLRSCMVNTSILLLPALCKLLRIAARTTSVCHKAIENIASLLKYTSPRALFSTLGERLLLSWLRDGNELRHFPATVFGYTSLFEFYREECAVVSLTLLIEDHHAQLSQVFEVLGTTPKDALENVCSHLLGGIMPMNTSFKESDRDCAARVFTYLNTEIGPTIIKDCLKQDIDQVVTGMLLRMSDPVEGNYAKYSRSDSLVVKYPVFPSKTIADCIEYIRNQMKDSKKPGIFKLLSLSSGGVRGVLLNAYEQYYEAKNNSVRRVYLTCYQFLLDMILRDEHNSISSSGDWCHLATSVVTTVTQVLSRHCDTAPDPDETMTTQCCDILSSLLSTLPNVLSLLGSSVTELVKILSAMTSSSMTSSNFDVLRRVKKILQLLLKECISPKFLPIVKFGDEELDVMYSSYTSRPLQTKDLLTTVRRTEGAHWYLSNMTSSLTSSVPNVTSSSSDDTTIENTAIHTLLQSDDNDARLLLGGLDHIVDLDISLINTIDNPGMRDWSSIGEMENCGVITDALRPYLFDSNPEVQRTAYRAARNILRSATGKIFVKSCLDADLPIDDILPFAKLGNPNKAPTRVPLSPTLRLDDINLLSACSCDALRYLVTLATLKPDLLDNVLGLVLHDLLTSSPEYKPLLSSVISSDVERQPHLKHLQAIKYLSNKPIDKSGVRHNNFSWLELDWLMMCRAAIHLCQYTTALLYLELHVEGLDDSGQLSRSQRHCSDTDTQELLLEIFLNLKCSDAIYGTQCNSETSKLKVYSYQHKWYELINFSDLTGHREHLLTAVKHTSPTLLLPTLLGTQTPLSEDHYESAWRNSSWEFNPTLEHGLHGNIYSSLHGIRTHAIDTAALHIEKAHKESRALNPHDHFVYLQLLNEISSVISKQTRDVRSSLDYSKWEVLYQCRAVLTGVTGDNDIHVLLDCARAARRSSEFHPATRFLRQGMALDLSPQQTLALKSEQCKLEWAAGEERVALRHIDTLLHECTTTTPEYPGLLITKAGWLAETNTEFPSYIMENCLEEAVTWCQEHSDTSTLGNAHLKLALFADEQLKQQDQYFASTEYKADLAILEKTKGDLEMIKKTTGNKQPVNKKQYATFRQQVNQDESKMDKRKLERTEYLLTTVRNYICSLKLSSYSLENDLLVFRLCSLLLDNAAVEELCQLAVEEIPQIPTYKLLPPMYQLAARLGTAGDLNDLLIELITNTAREHPYHVLPILFALKNAQLDCTYIKGSKPQPRESRTQIARDILKSLASDPTLHKVVVSMDKLTDAYVEWANYNLKEDTAFTTRQGTGRAHKIPTSLKITKIKEIDCFPLMTVEIPVRCDGNYSANFPTVVGFKSEFESPGGVNLPKLTYVLCSDGVTRKQLVKGNDDMRQDSVMEQVFNVANQLLSKNQLSQNLHMRTYKVLPLSQRSGLVEWCENTMPIGVYLVGRGSSGAHVKYRPKDPKSSDVRAVLKAWYERNQAKLPEEYKKQCKKFKPVFRHYFTENFPNPAEWYKQKCNYTFSLATSSIVGHIVGLGDRHVQNILIDKATSELIHIDLGVAFDQGLLLHIPEKVPFRLTRDLVDALGITGTEGVFRRSCEHVMRVLQGNRDLLIAIIEVFIHDPLFNWCINDTTTDTKRKKRQTSTSSDTGSETESSSENSNNQAQRVLGSLKRKLEGIEEGVVLGVEGQINHLVRKAQDPANLSRIFVGWQAWI